MTRPGGLRYPSARTADGSSPRGINEYFKFDFLRALSDEAIDTLVDTAAKCPSAHTQIILEPLGGEVGRTDSDSMALAMPEVFWAYHNLNLWFDPAETDANVAFAREFAAAMAPYGVGVAYPNFLNADEGDQRPAGILRRAEVEAADRAQAALGSRQRLSPQPERAAGERLVQLIRAAVNRRRGLERVELVPQPVHQRRHVGHLLAVGDDPEVEAGRGSS